MSRSTRRKCRLCGMPAYGQSANGRMRFGGSDLAGSALLIGSRVVNAGELMPVCEDHRAMALVTRALTAQLGTLARQRAEREALSLSPAGQQALSARLGRLEALKVAALLTLTGDEIATLLAHSRRVARTAGAGGIGADVAFDDVRSAFTRRIAEMALRDVADDIPPADAVLMVNRAVLILSVSHVKMSRQGDASASLDAPACGASPAVTSGPDDEWSAGGQTFTRLDVMTLAHQFAGEDSERGEAARELLERALIDA